MTTIYKVLKFDGTFGTALEQLCVAQKIAGYKLVTSFYVEATNDVGLIFQKI